MLNHCPNLQSDGRVNRTSAFPVKSEFDSESGQTNNFRTGIQSFSVSRSAMKRQWGEQVDEFTCWVVGKGLNQMTGNF